MAQSAAIAAANQQWPGFAVGIAIALVAAKKRVRRATPGMVQRRVGCCVVVLGYAAAQAWLLRASR